MRWHQGQRDVKAPPREDLFPSSCTQVLAKLRSSRAAGQGLLAKGLPKLSSLGRSQHGGWLPAEGVSMRESTVEEAALYNLILEATSHHFCCILFTRSKSLGPPALKGRGLHRGVNTRDDQGQSWREPAMLLSITRLRSRKIEFKVVFTSVNSAPNSKLCLGLRHFSKFGEQNLGWLTTLGYWLPSPALSHLWLLTLQLRK